MMNIFFIIILEYLDRRFLIKFDLFNMILLLFNWFILLFIGILIKLLKGKLFLKIIMGFSLFCLRLEK